jgi:hypothetical protein
MYGTPPYCKAVTYRKGPIYYGTGRKSTDMMLHELNPSMPSWACRSLRINPPAGRPAAAVQLSNFDWLDYGLILLVN